MISLANPTLDDYVGLASVDGSQILGDSHLMQSLRDILGTPKGTRVMRRDYGSDIPDLMDAPMSGELVADIVAAAAEAIIAWEPRVILKKVVVAVIAAGQFTLNLVVDLNGQELTLEGVV